MITLQYVLSSILFIIPFIIAGIIEATYDNLFLKTGSVLDLLSAGTINFKSGTVVGNVSGSFRRTVYTYTNGSTTYQLIGSNSPYLFYASDKPSTTSLDDYKNKFEIKFTDSLKFKVLYNGKEIDDGYFPDTGRKFLDDKFLLYRYSYGQWLSVILLGVFGITIFRILNKEITIANIVQASKKFRFGLFGFDTSLEEGRGYTVIKAVKLIFNFFGWIVSFFVFPTSNTMFYISFLVIYLTFIISFGMTVEKYNLKWNAQWKTAAGVSFAAIPILFIAFRYLSDRSDPEAVVTRSGSVRGNATGINSAANPGNQVALPKFISPQESAVLTKSVFS